MRSFFVLVFRGQSIGIVVASIWDQVAVVNFVIHFSKIVDQYLTYAGLVWLLIKFNIRTDIREMKKIFSKKSLEIFF